MSITLALGAATTGLQTSQQGLDSVSRNIANVNTEGYTRKVFQQESIILDGRGSGVQSAGLERTVDESILNDLRSATTANEEYSAKATYYSRIQDMFGTPDDNSSIAHTVTELAESFEALGVDVSSLTQASNTISTAEELANQLQNMTDMIQDLRLEADRALEADVLTANNLLEQIDELNAEIVRYDNTFLDTGDLKDQRDQALTELSGLMDITYFSRDSGDVIILTSSGQSLLDSSPATLTHQAVTQTSAELSYDAGDFNTISLDGTDITETISSGSMGAYVEIRDQILPAMQSELDELASQMKEALNQAHNRGTSYPDLAQDFNGTRTFIDSSNQSIELTSGDVALVLYNSDGTEAASDTLTNLMGGTSGTVDDVVTALNSFFSAYSGSAVTWASVDADGQMNIEIPSTETVGFAMRDEDSTGEAADATIAFDANGDGNVDETVSGFSNFFGLNDFFTNAGNNYQYDSDIVSTSWNANATSGIEFGIASNTSISTITIEPTDNLASIAAKINADTALQAENISASIIDEGSGARLRILQNDGEELMVAETTSQGVLSRIGVEPSKAGNADDIQVRDTLQSDSSKLSRGILQMNSDTGQYMLASGDNTVANQMAAVFTDTTTFEEAGNLSSGSLTMSEYASSILADNATEANRNELHSITQSQLTESLTLKNSETSGVNLDEELTQLMIFQQAYTAAARVISTTQELFDVLNNIIR